MNTNWNKANKLTLKAKTKALQQKYLGIEIGGTKLQIACGHPDGSTLSNDRFAVDKKEGAMGIQMAIERTVKNYSKGEISAIGIGFGGPVNRFTGKIETSFHIQGWSGFAIRDWLENIAEVPVFVDNDANVAALAEATHGSGKDYEIVLYVTLGSGVGAGLTVNGAIFHGAIPGELEIGHIQMDRDGSTLQSRCSGWAVDEKIRNAIQAQSDGILANLVSGKTFAEATVLNEAINAGDESAIGIFEETMDDLAFGLSHAVHLLHPDVLVLGGGLSFIGERLRDSVQEKLPRYLMKAFHPGPVVKLAQLQEKAVPVGSVVLAHQNLQKLY